MATQWLKNTVLVYLLPPTHFLGLELCPGVALTALFKDTRLVQTIVPVGRKVFLSAPGERGTVGTVVTTGPCMPIIPGCFFLDVTHGSIFVLRMFDFLIFLHKL